MNDEHPQEELDEAPQGQGEPVAPAEPATGSQDPLKHDGFDPNRAVATSAPAPEAQTGVPDLSDGSNDEFKPGGERDGETPHSDEPAAE